MSGACRRVQALALSGPGTAPDFRPVRRVDLLEIIMKHTVAAIFVALAVGIGMSAPARANPPGLSECTESKLWTVESLITSNWPDYTELVYLCTTDGWVLIGSTYCSGGICSSD